MLQKYLNHQLINIGDDDNLQKLNKACEDVVKKLSKNKQLIIGYTLISIDPNCSAENDSIKEVHDLINKYWKTFVSNSKDTPITIIRAVILESLENLSKANISFACLIWLTARNAIKYLSLGREENIIVEFLSNIANHIQKEAEKEWSLSSILASSKLQEVEIQFDDLPNAQIDKSKLTKLMEYASGPRNKEGNVSYKSPNPNWTNEGEQWSFEFASRAAEGISIVVNESLKSQSAIINTNQVKIHDVLKSFIGFLKVAEEKALKRNFLRTQLLWWKESRYSTTLNKSYRDLKPGLLEIAVGMDYAGEIPFLFPNSADYFLKETYSQFVDGAINSTTIKEKLSQINENKIELQKFIPELKEASERITILNFIKGFIYGKYSIEQFESLTGIDNETIITETEFVLWIFHDTQTQKIVQIK